MNAQLQPLLKPTRESIEALQAEVAKLPQIRLTTGHFLCDGMYIRILLIPKGAVIIGKVHRKEHFFMVLSGDITVARDGAKVHFKGTSCPLVSLPGVKRAGWAHEDTLVMTVHRAEGATIEDIEEEISYPDPDSKYLPGNILKPQMLPEAT
jgi:hypothetical protein